MAIVLVFPEGGNKLIGNLDSTTAADGCEVDDGELMTQRWHHSDTAHEHATIEAGNFGEQCQDNSNLQSVSDGAANADRKQRTLAEKQMKHHPMSQHSAWEKPLGMLPSTVPGF